MSVGEHFFRPRNVGDASEPSFVGRAASMQCGASVRVSIQIDEQHRIGQAKFKAAGCSTLVASLSMLTQRVTGLAPADAAVVAQSPASIVGNSEDLSCAKLGCDALIAAIQKYSDAVRHEWNGDEALICTCFCVSERVIESEIAQKGLSTVSEVIRACNAGGGCGSCHPLIEEMLDAVGNSI
ncbi:MAG TPA: iron-sulfur cluster assembly scaffold protein [Pyrinomonadaceae bacterium]|nr:iron-sulfur cluster assembly scaffold protein [Pyrinomonadaceae bacterium]